MAQLKTVRLVDDFDGTDATETISFGIDGKAYEIDLSAANSERFRKALAEYVGAARVVRRRGSRKLSAVSAAARVSTPQRSRKGPAAEKREWLAANGFPGAANKRGRFTAEQEQAWRDHVAADGGGKAPSVVEEAPAEAPQEEEAYPATKAVKATATSLVAAFKEGIASAKTAAVAPGKRTRMSGMTGAQVNVLADVLPELVIERGSTWALLDGDPASLADAIKAKREAGVGRGENNALASVTRKLKAADPKHVKVSDAA